MLLWLRLVLRLQLVIFLINLSLHKLIFFFVLLLNRLVMVLQVLTAPLDVLFEVTERKNQTQVHFVDFHFWHVGRNQGELVVEPCRCISHNRLVFLLEGVEDFGHGLLELAACPECFNVLFCHVRIEVARLRTGEDEKDALMRVLLE